MLAELYHIAKNLSHQGQEKRLVHADFGEPGLSTNVNLRLLLSDEGTIVRLDPLQAEDAVSLWTLKKHNFKFFPAVRMPNPLLHTIPCGVHHENQLLKPFVHYWQTEGIKSKQLAFNQNENRRPES